MNIWNQHKCLTIINNLVLICFNWIVHQKCMTKDILRMSQWFLCSYFFQIFWVVCHFGFFNYVLILFKLNILFCPTTYDTSNYKKTKLIHFWMFSHRALPHTSNLSLITGVRSLFAQLKESVKLCSVFKGQTVWTLSLSVACWVLGCFYRATALLVQFVRGCETLCLGERVGRLATLNHTAISKVQEECRAVTLLSFLEGHFIY